MYVVLYRTEATVNTEYTAIYADGFDACIFVFGKFIFIVHMLFSRKQTPNLFDVENQKANMYKIESGKAHVNFFRPTEPVRI